MTEGATSATLEAAAALWGLMRRELLSVDRGSLRSYLVRSAAGSILLNVASMFLRLAIGVTLARALGTTGYGVYAYALALLELIKLPTTLGLPPMVTRQVAVYRADEDWGCLRGLLLRANQAVVGLSLLLVLAVGGATWFLSDWFTDPHALATFWIALLLLPLFGLEALRGACLSGLQRVLLGQIPGALVRPALFLILIGSIWLAGGRRLTPELTMSLQVVTVGCSFGLGAFWLLRNLPAQVRRAVSIYESRAWAKGALPFALIGGLLLINGQTDIIMLGWLGTAADVGVYRVVSLSAGLVTFALGAVYTVLFPTFARLHAEGDVLRLQQVVTQSARALLGITLPPALVLLLFGGWILPTIFGPDYAVGTMALAFLVVGQLALASMGLAGQVLSAAGFAQAAARSSIVAVLLNVILNALLIPLWGLNGAAFASAMSAIIWDVRITVLAYRRLRLHTTVLGSLEFRVRARPS